MSRSLRALPTLVVAASLLPLATLTTAEQSAPAADGAAVHWTYEGAEGPEHWGEIGQDFGLCATGHEQSPINLAATIPAEADPVEFAWNRTAAWSVVNNGHTLQANTTDGGSITVAGTRYDLLQFHFHHPSEHALDHEILPMEVHFVHRAESGALAVVGVMIEEGGQIDLLDAVVQAAPSPLRLDGVGIGAADPSQFLPEDDAFYRYQGSLTTPPCSETVLWTVMQQPVRVDAATIAAFAELFHNNARPVQERYRRFVLSSN